MFNLDANTIQYLSDLSDIGSFIFSIISSIILGYIAFKSLQFTAKPKFHVNLIGKKTLTFANFAGKLKLRIIPLQCYWLLPGFKYELKFEFINKGHWYAKPAIVIDELYLNFDGRFTLLGGKYGAALEQSLTSENLKLGKFDNNGLNNIYFQLRHMHLFFGETNEEAHIEVIAPTEPGVYKVWIAALTKDASFRIFRFYFNVLS